jgi:putative transposase
VRYAFIIRNEKHYPISALCRVLKVSRPGYYVWKNSSKSVQSKSDDDLLGEIQNAYAAGRGTYGYRRVYQHLLRNKIICSLGKVRRLMHQNGIFRKSKRKFKITTDSKHNLPVAPNLLNREFIVESPNKAWVSDITYIWTDEGWLYLAVFIDLFSRKVVGWSMDTRISRKLILDAIEMAFVRMYPSPGLIVHSDRGSQYASDDFRRKIEKLGFKQSMSRKGDCWDNAVAESFFGTIKTEMIYNKKFKTIEEARRNIFDYVEVFYNRVRLHSTLGYMSPDEFETNYKLKAAA